MRGETEHAARATAARRAVSSAMDPDEHARRYLRFMRSPAYEAERDVVAVDPGGKIGAFAIHWPDTRLSLAQFEPVGTDPSSSGVAYRERLSRPHRTPPTKESLVRSHDERTNAAAAACYSACGSELSIE